MWKMIRTLTPTILVGTCSLLAMSWTRSALESQIRTLQTLLSEKDRDYTSLTKTLLGVSPDSQSQQPATLKLVEPQSWQPPDAPLGDLPIDENLMREYQEHLDSQGNLSGKPARVHPEVPQIVPGWPMTETMESSNDSTSTS
jgi:hypothetical protein